MPEPDLGGGLASWLLDHTSEAFLVTRLEDGTILHANEATARLTGYPLEELIGRTAEELGMIPPGERAGYLAGVDTGDEGVTGAEGRGTIRTTSGEERTIRFDLRIATLLGERVVVALLQDLGDRLRSEHEIRDVEARYRALVEQIPAIVYIDALDGPNTTLYISPQTESILGFSQQDWLDDPELLSKHVHPDDHPSWREMLRRADRTGEPLNLEYRIVASDGRIVWVHDEAVLVRGADGRARFWQGVMFDITALKAAEEVLREAFERERVAAQRLRTLDEMKNTFLQAVSHELRTPLTAILGVALTLEGSDVDMYSEDARDLVRRLSANARKLHRLLGDLLDLDRLERGIIEPTRQPMDVAALARRVVAESDVLAGHPIEVDGGSVVVSVDGPKVERIVENLVANAARHTPAGTPVSVRIRSEDGGVLLQVDDRGPGVPEELRDSIFEPFQRGDATVPGVGVGLSLVARFAELHGGRAWVQERDGGGASFCVFLPGLPAGQAAPR